jgi:transcription antitermination factor NusA-like protein
MSNPICEVCAKTGVLCGVCEKKLQENRISSLDVELSQMLYKLTGGEVRLEGAIDVGGVVIILVKKEDIGKVIGKNGVNIRKLSQKINKEVRVVGAGDMREAIHDFIAPAKVMGVNRVYLPGSSELQRIKIDAKDKDKLRMKTEDIQKILETLAGTPVELVFE